MFAHRCYRCDLHSKFEEDPAKTADTIDRYLGQTDRQTDIHSTQVTSNTVHYTGQTIIPPLYKLRLSVIFVLIYFLVLVSF